MELGSPDDNLQCQFWKVWEDFKDYLALRQCRRCLECIQGEYQWCFQLTSGLYWHDSFVSEAVSFPFKMHFHLSTTDCFRSWHELKPLLPIWGSDPAIQIWILSCPLQVRQPTNTMTTAPAQGCVFKRKVCSKCLSSAEERRVKKHTDTCRASVINVDGGGYVFSFHPNILACLRSVIFSPVYSLWCKGS